MRVEIDVPSHLLNYNRNRQLLIIAANLIAALIGVVVFYQNDGSTPTAMFGFIVGFVALQPVLIFWNLGYVPSQKEREQVSIWIRTYGPDLIDRVLFDVHASGAAIGTVAITCISVSPQLLTRYVTESELAWAIESDLYSLRDEKMLRLMQLFLPEFGMNIGVQRVIHFPHDTDMPYFAVSEKEIACCAL